MKNYIMCWVLHLLPAVVLASTSGRIKFCSWYEPTSKCLPTEFRCRNDQKCIRPELYCNGVDNCGDFSDEFYCDKCYGSFGCNTNNGCFLRTSLCNGLKDCANGYDEERCGGSLKKTNTNVTEIDRVTEWIGGLRKELNAAAKWGSSVDRIAMMIYLTAENFSDLEYGKPDIDYEMEYELNIQLLSRLSNTKLEDIPATELASYLNAYLLMCINPRNFHGYDLIEELRERVDHENYTNPYVLLTLCNAGETITESDKNKLIDIFRNEHRTIWTGMQAVAVMALACASKQPESEVDSEMLHEMALELKQLQYRNGTVINLPTTALVMQALISIDSESDPDNFDERKAYQELLRNQKADGSFGDITTTLLVAPVLACKSLIDINSHHCQYGSRDETSALENLSKKSGPKIRVQYSLWIGNDRDLERNLVLRVPQNMSLYKVMETAADIDSRFKFEYAIKNRKPYIYAITGMRDNPLTGKFWFLYAVERERPILSNESPADIMPKDNDHYIMWYRRGTWVDERS